MNYLSMGNRIREERLKLNLTQEQLAEKVHVSSAYIGQIERGERSVSLDVLLEIVNALGVTVDYLLADSYTGKYNESVVAYSLFRLLENRDPRDVDTAFAVINSLFDCLETYKRRPWSNNSFASSNGKAEVKPD